MKVVITGSSGLALNIGNTIAATPHIGTIHIVTHVRVEDVIDWSQYDAFINCVHVEFEQCFLLMDAFESWRYDDSKTIINISSRASQPNISKGYLYAAQKAALNHLSNNLVYNSDKRCRITTMNLGLLEHQDLPSISYSEVSSWIYSHLVTSKHYDVPEITIQNRANYQGIQSDKEVLRDLQRFTK
jgi:NAD(P)-dependent dehydrogenase (short-subunit alcohol dehydrogenase family)